MFTPLPVNHWSLRPDGLPHGGKGAGRLPDNWPAGLPITGWGDVLDNVSGKTVNGSYHYYDVTQSSARIDSLGNGADLTLLSNIPVVTPDGFWGYTENANRQSSGITANNPSSGGTGSNGNDIRYCSEMHMQATTRIIMVNRESNEGSVLGFYDGVNIESHYFWFGLRIYNSNTRVGFAVQIPDLILMDLCGVGANADYVGNIQFGASAYREGSNVRIKLRLNGAVVKEYVVPFITMNNTVDSRMFYGAFVKKSYINASTYYHHQMKDVMGFSLA